MNFSLKQRCCGVGKHSLEGYKISLKNFVPETDEYATCGLAQLLLGCGMELIDWNLFIRRDIFNINPREIPGTHFAGGKFSKNSPILDFSIHKIYLIKLPVRPASWSSGQSLWLLIMRSRVRFPVLPWEFSLKGRIPAVTMVWVGY